MTDLAIGMRRLEQQVNAFEQLHAEELRRFEEQLATYRQLQADELNELRAQLQRLQDELAMQPERATGADSDAAANPQPLQLTVARRDVLGGQLPSFAQTQS